MSGDHRVIEAAMRAAGLKAALVDQRRLSGGCIHDVRRVELSGGHAVVAKLGAPSAETLFREEAGGLQALAATGTVLVPEPLVVGCWAGRAVLLMTAIEPAPSSERSWAALGEALARLHAAPAGDRYGFEMDNHLGPTPQPNRWSGSWTDFNRECRLGHQLGLLAARDLLDADARRLIERVVDRLDTVVPVHPKPALLHGDLWSGNALPTVGERFAVIDPACSIGDGWADIAMMRLFGGFSETCFRAYAASIDDHDDPADVERRIDVYQLYHVLNHVTIFGRGYVGQAVALARRILG